MTGWLTENGDGIVLTVRVQPRASRSEVVGTLGDALKIRLQAPPVDGKANAALRAFLADALVVPERRVVLVSGETSRTKRVRVDGVRAASARAALLK